MVRDYCEATRALPSPLKDFATLKIVEKKAHIVKDPETGHQYISPAEHVLS